MLFSVVNIILTFERHYASDTGNLFKAKSRILEKFSKLDFVDW
jgi:hypothetical protein